VFIVGLTGGIGSGKSTVGGLLRGLGVDVLDADEVARECVRSGTPVLAAIVERFGPQVLTSDGELDRSLVAELVFFDDAARHDLETLVHPCVRTGLETRLAALRTAPEPPLLVVVEHPLLVETDAHELVDAVVVVDAPLDLRVARVVAARGLRPDQVIARARAQASDEVRRTAATYLLPNDGDVDALRASVATLLASLRIDAQQARDGSDR
jgi:dephospho-CoA kinase